MNRQLVKPIEPNPGRTRCSFVDQCVALVFPSVVLGYAEQLDATRLQHALASVLADFTAFSGRLRRNRGDWFIEHGAGVWFETARSEETFETLGAAVRARHSKVVCPQLSLISTLRGKCPLFAARLTHTRDGSVLGVTWNHALSDYHGMMLLLRAWAQAYGDRPYKKPFLVADRESYLNEHIPAADDTNAETTWRRLAWSEYLRTTWLQLRTMRGARRLNFDFTWDQIDAIRATMPADRPISASDALCAHFFWKLRALSDEISSQFAIALDCRKTFGLPTNLVANASDFVNATIGAEEGPDSIATALRDRIAAFGAASFSPRALQKLKASFPRPWDALRFWGPGEPGRTNLRLTNVSRAGHHRLIFADAAPAFLHTRPTDALIPGMGIVFGSPRASGLTIDVVLPSKLARVLTREQHGRGLSASLVASA